MASVRDVKLLERGIGKLLNTALGDVAAANRAMLEPMLESIRSPTVTGNDRVDAKRLKAEVEQALLGSEVDDERIIKWAEQTLLQTYALSRTAAIPDDVDENAVDPQLTPEEELSL